MPIIFNLISSILLGIGFFFLGFLTVNIFGIKKIVQKISKPEYQYCLFGIVFFLFILYPLFFYGFIKNYLFKYISFFLIFLSFLAIFYFRNYYFFFLKNFFKNFKTYLKSYNFFFLFILLYFFLSLGPITSGDSLNYHTDVARYIYLNGEFPRHSFDFNSYLSGVGEFLNAFALSINAFQFTSFIHFLGLVSMLGIIEKLLIYNFVNIKNRQFFYLLVLACPVLIFLISSSKPQFFYTALIIFCYSCLININKFSITKEKYIIIIISTLFSCVAIAAKLSFSISFFIIFLNYYLLSKKTLQFYLTALISILLFILFIFPSLFWKQNLYHYSFYHFLFNPFPINIPGMTEATSLAHNYDNEGFPLSIIFPLSLSKMTLFIGFGFLLPIYFLKTKFINKKIFLFNIIFFLIVWSYFGQRSPRFYLEIYLFFILIFVIIYKDISGSLFIKYFKYLIYFQSLFVFCVLSYGVISLFPGSLNQKLMQKTLSLNANGYDLYSWVNKSLPSNSSIIVNNKAVYTSLNKTIYLDFINYIDFDNNLSKNYWLLKLKEQKPEFILFYGKENNFSFNSYNFKNCVGKLLISQRNVGFYASRNPFNRDRETYNAYIYRFVFEKLPNCVKKNV
jgi:hypothetical protein